VEYVVGAGEGIRTPEKEVMLPLVFLRSYFPSFSLFRTSLAGEEIGEQKGNELPALWKGIAWRVLARRKPGR
jgi:hypothetical protein